MGKPVDRVGTEDIAPLFNLSLFGWICMCNKEDDKSQLAINRLDIASIVLRSIHITT